MGSWSQVTQGSTGRRWTIDPLYQRLRGLPRWGTFSAKSRESVKKVSHSGVLCPALWLFVAPWTGPPGSSDHGILQARILECVATPICRGYSQPRGQTCVSWNAGRFFTGWAPRIQGNPRQIQTHRSLSLGVSVAHMPKLSQLRLEKPNCNPPISLWLVRDDAVSRCPA